jgi:group I intron endonuclease
MEIYKTTNLLNGLIYIGKSVKHRPSYLGSGIHLVRAVKKDGRINFKKEIIEFCSSQKELNEREIFWIKELDARNPSIGYNITAGGDGWTGHHHSEESKKKMSIAKKGKHPSEEARKLMSLHNAHNMKGKHHSDATRKKLSDIRKGQSSWNKGLHHSEETKRKISENCSGFTGKHHTEEHKKHMSQLKKGVPRPQEVTDKMKATKRLRKNAQNTTD